MPDILVLEILYEQAQSTLGIDTGTRRSELSTSIPFFARKRGHTSVDTSRFRSMSQALRPTRVSQCVWASLYRRQDFLVRLASEDPSRGKS